MDRNFFDKQNHIVCGIIYRQRNSPYCFKKNFYVTSDLNLGLLKNEKYQYS